MGSNKSNLFAISYSAVALATLGAVLARASASPAVTQSSAVVTLPVAKVTLDTSPLDALAKLPVNDALAELEKTFGAVVVVLDRDEQRDGTEGDTSLRLRGESSVRRYFEDVPREMIRNGTARAYYLFPHDNRAAYYRRTQTRGSETSNPEARPFLDKPTFVFFRNAGRIDVLFVVLEYAVEAARGLGTVDEHPWGAERVTTYLLEAEELGKNYLERSELPHARGEIARLKKQKAAPVKMQAAYDRLCLGEGIALARQVILDLVATGGKYDARLLLLAKQTAWNIPAKQLSTEVAELRNTVALQAQKHKAVIDQYRKFAASLPKKYRSPKALAELEDAVQMSESFYDTLSAALPPPR